MMAQVRKCHTNPNGSVNCIFKNDNQTHMVAILFTGAKE